MSSMRSIYDVFAAPTASFGKFDCAMGNMSTGGKVQNDVHIDSYFCKLELVASW